MRLAIVKAQYDERIQLLLHFVGIRSRRFQCFIKLPDGRRKKSSRVEQLLAMSKTVQYNRKLFNYGYVQTSYLDIFTSQQSYLAAQLDQVNDQL